MRTYTKDEVEYWWAFHAKGEGIEAFFARKDEESDPYPHYYATGDFLWRHDGPEEGNGVCYVRGKTEPCMAESGHGKKERISTEEGKRREAELEAKRAEREASKPLGQQIREAEDVPRNADGDSIEDMRKVQERIGVRSVESATSIGFMPCAHGLKLSERNVDHYRITAKHADKFDPKCMDFETWARAAESAGYDIMRTWCGIVRYTDANLAIHHYGKVNGTWERCRPKHAAEEQPEQGPVRCEVTSGRYREYADSDGAYCCLHEALSDDRYIAAEYADGTRDARLRLPSLAKGKPARVPVALWFAGDA